MNPQQYYGGQVDPGGYPSANKKKFLTRRNLLFIAIGFLVVLAAAAGILSAVSRDPADNLMAQAMKGDAIKSYSLLGPKAQDVYSEASWATEVGVLSNIYIDYALDSKSTKTSEDGSSVTTYRFTLTPKDAKNGNSAWTVIKVEDPKEGPTTISDYRFRSLKKQ